MSTGRTPEQAREDQDQRDRDNLQLRNHVRDDLGLRPLDMREFLAERGRGPGAPDGMPVRVARTSPPEDLAARPHRQGRESR